MRFTRTHLAQMSCCLLVLFGLQSAVFAQSEAPASQASAPRAEEARLSELPDSPGAVRFQSQDGTSQTGAAQISSSQPVSGTSSTATTQTTPAQQTSAGQSQPSQPQVAPQAQQQTPPPDSKPQQPVGTAVAATPVVSGSPAAQPAGVAVAPAKQHRTRTIVIRIGAVVGAAVAIGTVVALSEGTSSRPPGAR